MRTTKNILLGLSLLLGAALMIASAQAARVGIVANPLVGRAGGGAELAGIIELTTGCDTWLPRPRGAIDGNVGIGFISLRFSVPVVESSVITITDDMETRLWYHRRLYTPWRQSVGIRSLLPATCSQSVRSVR